MVFGLSAGDELALISLGLATVTAFVLIWQTLHLRRQTESLKDHTESLRDQTKLLSQRLVVQAVTSVMEKVIDIDSRFASMTEVFPVLPAVTVLGLPEKDSPKSMFVLVVLNELDLVYDLHRQGFISEDDWAPWDHYLKGLFKTSEFRTVWDKVREQQWFSPPFMRCVDTVINGAQSPAMGSVPSRGT